MLFPTWERQTISKKQIYHGQCYEDDEHDEPGEADGSSGLGKGPLAGDIRAETWSMR